MVEGRYLEIERDQERVERGYPLCLEEDDVKHILLVCKETKSGGKDIYVANGLV
jgi:hypothetical protein